MSSNILKDKNLQKSLINLKYLAYFVIGAVVFFGFGVFTYYAIDLYNNPKIGNGVIALYWIPIVYIVSVLIILGLLDVLKIITNLSQGNIFTFENASLLKKIDKLLITNLIFSLIVNTVMVLANWHFYGFLLIWVIYMAFLLIGHVLVASLSILVEKSAEMRLEMDLTI